MRTSTAWKSSWRAEINRIINLIDRFYKLFGFEYRMELSTKPENSMGDPLLWEKAESTLKKVLDGRNVKYEMNAGDGAFYGPKIDFKIRDSLEPGVADRHHTAGLPDAGEIPDKVCRR